MLYEILCYIGLHYNGIWLYYFKIRQKGELKHWCLNKMVNILQTTFSNEFSSMKIFSIWFKFHLSLWIGVDQLAVYYLNWCGSWYVIPYGINRLWWVKMYVRIIYKSNILWCHGYQHIDGFVFGIYLEMNLCYVVYFCSCHQYLLHQNDLWVLFHASKPT